MLDADEIDSILELATIEADRWGHKSANLSHVVYVMATVFGREFKLQFGKFGRVLLEDLLRSNTSPAGMQKARAILRASDSVDAALLAFHQLLTFPEVMTDDMELEAHERWLVLHIVDRFRVYGRKPDNYTLDELYVLIAALKVVGLDRAYEAMKAQLVSARNGK